MKERSIIYLLHGYYPADPRVRRQAEALAAAGWRVEVLCTSASGRPEVRNLNGVLFRTIPLQKTRGSLSEYLRQYIEVTRSYRRILAARGDSLTPAIVQVATLPDFLVAAARPARRRGAKVILDFHESMPEFFASKYGTLLGSLARRFLIALERWCAAQADCLLTVNDVIADNFAARLGRRPLVIYNSADERLFNPLVAAERAARGRRAVFGYHGTFTSIYGLDLLLSATASVVSRGYDIEIRLLGSGPEESNLRRLAEKLAIGDRVSFLGRVPLEEIPRRIAGFDAGVVPTRKDQFLDMSLGTKLLEYVCLNKLTVSSDLAAVKRVFSSSNSIVYFRANSAENLAGALESVLVMDHQTRKSRVERARVEYEKIGWPKMRKRYCEIVERLVED